MEIVGLGTVRDVRALESHQEDVFSLPLIVPVNLFVKEEILETVDEFEVFAKVCVEDQVDDEITNFTLASFRELVQKVVFGLQEHPEGFTAVVILEHRLVIVEDGIGVVSLDEEEVGETRVVDIVHDG